MHIVGGRGRVLGCERIIGKGISMTTVMMMMMRTMMLMLMTMMLMMMMVVMIMMARASIGQRSGL